METLKNFLWPIVAIGGLGALIDFLIGKAGQEKAKDFLLRWWVRFDDVRWNNFGREEGLFSGQLIEKWFGRRMWTTRRIAIAFSIFVLLILIEYFRLALSLSLLFHRSFCIFCHAKLYVAATALIASFVGFCISVSFTIVIAFRAADLCGMGKLKNLGVFIAMLVVNYLLFVYWSPVTGGMRRVLLFVVGEYNNKYLSTEGLLYTVRDAMADIINRIYSVPYPTTFINVIKQKRAADDFALICLPLFPSLFRIFLSIVFVGSFLLRPFVMRPVSLIWARIIESEKPVFTLTLGGAAAFATAIGEAAKHL
jgi:hypothetical protein